MYEDVFRLTASTIRDPASRSLVRVRRRCRKRRARETEAPGVLAAQEGAGR